MFCNLSLHAAVSKLNLSGNLIAKSSQLGTYADYIVIVGRGENAAKGTLRKLVTQTTKDFTIDDNNVKREIYFVYLGLTVNKCNLVSKEIKLKI